MTTRRTFTAAEIAKILSSQKLNDDCALDLGNGLIAKQTAMAYKNPEHPSFMLERNGKDEGNIEKAGEAMLKELSEILWTKIAPQFMDNLEILDEKLTPDALLEKSEDVLDPMTPDSLKEVEDPLEGKIEALTPDALRPKSDDPNLEPDPLGLTPDSLRAIIADPGLARRLAMGTATAGEKIDDLLTPDHYKDQGDK